MFAPAVCLGRHQLAWVRGLSRGSPLWVAWEVSPSGEVCLVVADALGRRVYLMGRVGGLSPVLPERPLVVSERLPSALGCSP